MTQYNITNTIPILTSYGQFPLSILEAGDVAGAPGGGDHDDEEGRGDEAVEDQHEEHQHVVGLEVLHILVETLGQPPGGWGHLLAITRIMKMMINNNEILVDVVINLEIRGVEEDPERTDVRLSPSEPFLDGGLGEGDGHGETHAASEHGLLADTLLNCCGGRAAVNLTTQLYL